MKSIPVFLYVKAKVIPMFLAISMGLSIPCSASPCLGKGVPRQAKTIVKFGAPIIVSILITGAMTKAEKYVQDKMGKLVDQGVELIFGKDKEKSD